MPMDNVTLENTQQSISSRDAKSVASVMVNGKWVNLSDTLEQANVKSDVGTVAKQVAAQQEVVSNAASTADSAVAYANDAIKKSRVNSQAIDDINSAVSDAVSDAAVARSDGLRAWDAAQSNVDLIDLNYASASAEISSARTEAIAAADEAKVSASAAKADIVAVRSDVATVQADVTTNKSDVAAAKSDIAIAKTNLASQATSLSSYAAQASAAGKDITTLKSQAGQFEQDMADTKGDVSQLKVSASSASATLSDAAGNISSLQATAKSYSAALSDTNSNVASVTATASSLETKYADAAGDISKIKTDAKGMTQTISNAQGDIAKLKTRADGFDAEFSTANGNISKLQTDASGTKQTLTNAKSDIAVLQSRADGIDAKYANAAGDINTLKANASGFSQALTNAKGDISTLQATATGFKNTLTDAQGNISTLQSDVSGLKKTTSDHAGNIATLQADAKTLTSQMSSAQGDISTLKQTASGFSSKVSGMETSLADANGKINDIQVGGRNLIHDTSFEQGLWKTAWGNPSFEVTNEGNIKFSISDTHQHGVGVPLESVEMLKPYTLTLKIRGHAPFEPYIMYNEIPNLSLYNDLGATYPMIDSATEFVDIKYTFTPVNRDITKQGVFAVLTSGAAGNWLEIKKDSLKLESGNVATDWQPAPEDVDAKITTNSTAIEQNRKAITLKADQATVDKANGTVQKLQSQLKVQADQINSKVSSSDLNAKGYATQEYTQTQIKQTSDSWNANLTSVKNGLTQSYTNLHATVDGIQGQVFNKDGSSKITQLSNVIQTKVGTDDFNNLKQAVGLQTLESADINNMKTTGHYFVHNLSSNPIGGWVYVDVTGDGSSRIRQDVYQDNGTKHKYRRWVDNNWTDWEEGATYTEINQLQDAINLRVTKGDLISQINLQAGTSLIQSNKLVLDANTTVITGNAFIPSAAIAELDADKLTFYGNGAKASIGASVAQYDDDKTKSTINLQYNGGIEIHSSKQQGSILTMHDNTIRLASKSWGDNPNAYQYSGFYAAPNYSLMNTYHRDGTTSGVAIDDNQIHIYGSSKDQQLGALKADVGWYSINGKTGSLTGDQISLKAGNTQAVLTDNNININNASDTNDKNYDVAIHVKGWAEMTGWFTCMGLTQTSLLSTKTRIEPLDTAKALELINSADVATYQYKQEVAHGGTKRHASVIIDDVNDVARYQTPDEIISEDRQGRNDGDIVGYLMGAVQELTKKLKTLESKVG